MQSYSLFGGSDSKCPVARLVNGGKPAEALIEEARLSASSPRFAVQDYNYVPFTAPSYQVRTCTGATASANVSQSSMLCLLQHTAGLRLTYRRKAG